MSKVIRVLTADDSAVMRRLLHEIISSESDLQVAASAENGEQAITLFRTERPDLLLLDVEMPNVNGVQAQRSIRAMNHRVPILMFSPSTVRGGELTLEALCKGATDFLIRPPETGHPQKVISALKTGLIPLVRYWGNQNRHSSVNAHQATQPETETDNPLKSINRKFGPLEIVVLGSPAWGVVPLHEILSRLPGDIPVPVLVVQSLPAQFMAPLATRLDRTSRLSVIPARDGTILRAGEIYLAEAESRLVVVCDKDQTVLKASDQDPARSAIGGIDILLESVAEQIADRALVIMLNGRKPDGFAGCRELYHSGAQVLVQDFARSGVSELPRLIVQFGLADASVTSEQVIAAIRARLNP